MNFSFDMGKQQIFYDMSHASKVRVYEVGPYAIIQSDRNSAGFCKDNIYTDSIQAFFAVVHTCFRRAQCVIVYSKLIILFQGKYAA